MRIFDTRNGQLIQEVRRGNEYATIYSLAFSTEGNWLAVSSDSNNLHIFSIQPTEVEVSDKLVRSSGNTRKMSKNRGRIPRAHFSS